MILLTQQHKEKFIGLINNRPDLYGTLTTPRGNRAQIPHCTGIIGVDNGAFSGVGFEPKAFLALLEWLKPYRSRVRFVACPDVVGDWKTTLALFWEWQPQIRRVYPYPVAIVLQDGVKLDEIPWTYCKAVFVGGSTEFKLSALVDDCIAEAQRRGKWVHVGRVSTRRRINHFRDVGVDSVDSSAFARWPMNLYNAARWLAQERFAFSLDVARRRQGNEL